MKRRTFFASLVSNYFSISKLSARAFFPTQILLGAHAKAQTPFIQRERTTLDITFHAAEDVNQDEKSRAAPILVRMYELRTAPIFEASDYFSLQSNDRAVLGTDLLMREEFVMRPGDSKKMRRQSHPDLQVLGWTAGYRELSQSEWRAIERVELAPENAWYRAPLPANKLKLIVNLQRQGIQVVHVD